LALPIAVAIAGLVALPSCSRKVDERIQRLAILPANVLVNDPSPDWMKLGVPVVLQQDLLTAHDMFPLVVKDEANAATAGAGRILRTTLESRQEKIHLEATLVNAATQKTISVSSVDAPSLPELITALNALAKRIDSGAREFGTKSLPALEAFGRGAADANPQTRFQSLGKAVAADPAFGLAYVALLDMLAPTGERNTKQLQEEAAKHRAAFSPYDGAKYDMLASRLTHASIADQVKAAQAVLALVPHDVDALSILGGNRFLQENGKGGEAALQQALQLNPANENLQNQLALGLISVKRFADAQKILTRLGKNPAALGETASCLLFQGDTAGAQAAVERFLASVSNADLRPVLRATWQAATGQRAQAIAAMESGKFPNKQIESLALSEAALWRLMDKDYTGAQKTAALANATPSSFSQITLLLAESGSPVADWRKKIDSLPGPNEAGKRSLLAYGLFLGGHYAEAAEVWRQIVDGSSGGDVRARAMLAGSLDRAGKTAEARKIPLQPFVLEMSDLYGAISFGEMRRVLGLH
jgi:cytochrome c-type biogenesis protein CcmH/NrfG